MVDVVVGVVVVVGGVVGVVGAVVGVVGVVGGVVGVVGGRDVVGACEVVGAGVVGTGLWVPVSLAGGGKFATGTPVSAFCMIAVHVIAG